MKINEFINESTTAGSIATVAAPMTTQKRNNIGKGVYGNEKPGTLLTGKKTNKKYANSVNESKMKQVAMDLENMQDGNFKQKYGKTKDQIKFLLGDPKNTKTVHEATLEEEDVILVPGQGHRLKTGFHAFDPDKAEHEGETLKNSLRTIARNAKELHSRLENHDQFPEWVSEKIGTIKGMMTAVTEYLISSQEPAEGVIAAGGVGEGIGEKIKGAIRREKAKDMPLVQTRRDYAMGKAGQAYEKGEPRKGAQYSAWAERNRKKMGHPTTNPTGTYRTKTSDYTMEAQSMSGALKNSLAKAESGSKLDKSIKAHNAKIKAGEAGSLKNAPEGYHFDKKGYCRLGDK